MLDPSLLRASLRTRRHARLYCPVHALYTNCLNSRFVDLLLLLLLFLLTNGITRHSHTQSPHKSTPRTQAMCLLNRIFKKHLGIKLQTANTLFEKTPLRGAYNTQQGAVCANAHAYVMYAAFLMRPGALGSPQRKKKSYYHSLQLHYRQFLVALLFADLPSLSPSFHEMIFTHT